MQNNTLRDILISDELNASSNLYSAIIGTDSLNIAKQSLDISKRSLKIWEDNIVVEQLRHRAEFAILSDILAELKKLNLK